MKKEKVLFYINRVVHLYSAMFISALWCISYYLHEDFSTSPYGLNQSTIDFFSILVLLTGLLHAFLIKVIQFMNKQNINIYRAFGNSSTVQILTEEIMPF